MNDNNIQNKSYFRNNEVKILNNKTLEKDISNFNNVNFKENSDITINNDKTEEVDFLKTEDDLYNKDDDLRISNDDNFNSLECDDELKGLKVNNY